MFLLKAALARFFRVRFRLRRVVFQGYEQFLLGLNYSGLYPFVLSSFMWSIGKGALVMVSTSPLAIGLFSSGNVFSLF